jgi:hypothetical protein
MVSIIRKMKKSRRSRKRIRKLILWRRVLINKIIVGLWKMIRMEEKMEKIKDCRLK